MEFLEEKHFKKKKEEEKTIKISFDAERTKLVC
jgi:hypothetical protein